MTLLLNSEKVFPYLADHGLCDSSQQPLSKVEPIPGKNFNLLVTFPGDRKLLVKQERRNREGKTAGEFEQEWRIPQFLAKFPPLDSLRPFLPEVLHFDPDHGIIVFNYLQDYRDLADFYLKENTFPTTIASEMGTILATIHSTTFDQEDYGQFFGDNSPNQVDNLTRKFARIGPEVFGLVPADGLKFFALYQRYDSLGEAMAELGQSFTPRCLTHNDLKLNNVLVKQSSNILRLIDWERSSWGDPAFDLGTAIASYLQIWLSSLVISKSLKIEESLRLATIPLELIQPSIAAMTQAYMSTFGKIHQLPPDFLPRVVQFAGFALIGQIQGMIQYQKSFGNTGIAMLQVAKTLLCHPQRSMATIFGPTAATELTQTLERD
ncbi:MAG: aminoglycoside phosphotransferase family protein [Prochloron sp. SP5CPC1]|nr:aminoglycoside phosphotransferase family protein [Candidatus Paraprochloron terpiosi SP5CPC1]